MCCERVLQEKKKEKIRLFFVAYLFSFQKTKWLSNGIFWFVWQNIVLHVLV